MKIKHPFRLTLITIGILLFSWGIIVQILHIINSDLHVQIKEEESIQIIPANRGNIYTINNKLLAVTSSKYDIRFDGVYANKSVKMKDLEQNLVVLGAKMGSSVSKRTTVLIAKAPTSNSSKIKRAQKLNIPIMSQEDFKKWLNTSE